MQEKNEGINNDEYKTIEEILEINKRNTEKLVDELDGIEANQRVETLDNVFNTMHADTINTNMKKDKFISELGMGIKEEIKRNQGVRRVEPEVKPKKTVFQRLNDLFTKF